MSSELHGTGGADRADHGADRTAESRDDPFHRVPRDVNAVPASAGWKPESGISRADYYPDFGKPSGDAPGQQADDAQRDPGADGPDAYPAGTAGLDSGADNGTDGGPEEQTEGSSSVDGGVEVQEVQEAPAEAAGAGGGPPPPDGPDVPGDVAPYTPGQDRWMPDDDESADDPGTVPGRDGAIDAGPPAGARETGEEDERGDSGAGRKTRPEAQEQPRQGDAAAVEDTGTRTDGDAEERESVGQPGEQDGTAGQPRERVQPAQETREEAVPDDSADQRMDAFEQRIQSMMEQKLQDALEAAKAEMKAEYEAKLDEQAAKHEAEIESIKTGYDAKLAGHDAKFDELEAKVDGGQPDGDGSPGRKPDSEEDPDISGAEQRGDRMQRGVKDPDHVPDDPAISQDQGEVLEERDNRRAGSDAKNAEPSRWRRLLTSDRVTAANTVATAVNAAAMFGMHASPEGMASLGMAILSLGGLGLAKIEKRRKEKKEKDELPD